MDQISRIGMDTSKRIFQLHGVDSAEQPILRRKLSRNAMVTFFERFAPTVVAIEACGAAHHWARELGRLGHTVKLIAPQLAKPYAKRGKNDAADAEALCEAMSRPTMRFVPVKTAEQQAALMLAGERERLVRQRTQLANGLPLRRRGRSAAMRANSGSSWPRDRRKSSRCCGACKTTRRCRRWRGHYSPNRRRTTRGCKPGSRPPTPACWNGTARTRCRSGSPGFPGSGRSSPRCW